MEETGFAYNVGDIVQCKTCHGDVMEGEVIAFDYNSRLIAISILLFKRLLAEFWHCGLQFYQYVFQANICHFTSCVQDAFYV